MDCLQESKDLITIFDWGSSGGQVASFFPNSSICMQHQKGILGVGVNGYSVFLFPDLKLESGIIGLKYLVAKV